MEFDPFEIIRSRPTCKVRWSGIPGRGDGEKELSQDEGPAELQKILDGAQAGGQVLFYYSDHKTQNKFHERELSPPL